jgi:hypothetical protein
MVSNMRSSSMCCSASDDRATSYDGSASDNRAATIDPASIIASASAIFVIRIALAAIVPTTYNCPSSNDRSTSIYGGASANCGASVN